MSDVLSEQITADTKVYVVLHNAYAAKLELPYKFWLTGQKWPPCDNYSQDEPINLMSIGAIRPDEHHCAGCKGKYDPRHDNSFHNMVVFEYKGGARTGLNKWNVLWHIQTSNKLEDPLTRLPLAPSIVDKLKQKTEPFQIFVIG